MRRLAAAVVVVGAIVAWTPTPASAQTGPGLGGYQGVAAGAALQVDYTPQGVLPIPSIVDIGAPDAVASISSGPTTFAQASVLDPGDLLANPDALLTLAGIIPGYQSGTIPPYPFRVSANSGFGEPSDESEPAPGLKATVRAEPAGSTARATTAAADGAPLASVGSMLALATTKTDGASVTVRSLTRASGITLFSLLNIDSVVTDLTAVSDGETTKLTGGTKVLGATLAGRKVTIDSTGVHADKNALPIPASLGKSLNDALKRAGITIKVSEPKNNDVAGRLTSGGLRIDFDNSVTTVPALDALFNALPPLPGVPIPMFPSPEDLLVAIKARHVAGIEVARGAVSLAGRLSAIGEDAPVDLPDLSTDVGGTFDVPSLPGVGALVPTTGAPSLGPTRSVGTTTTGTASFGLGIGGFLLIALLAQPFLGQALARVSRTVLAPAGAELCDREER